MKYYLAFLILFFIALNSISCFQSATEQIEINHLTSSFLERRSKLKSKRSKSKSKNRVNSESQSLSQLTLAESYNKQTNANDAGSGDVFYLDRHDIACSKNSALTSFRLQRQDPKMFYKYNCLTSTALSKKSFIDKQTNFDATDSNSVNSANYLDRHDVKCPDSYALQQFKLIRDGNRIAYKYRCVKFIGTDCKSQMTDETFGSNKRETYYLDRQVILLEPNRVLQGFRLTSRYDGNNAYYRYALQTCKLDDVDSKILSLRNQISLLNDDINNKYPKEIKTKEDFIKEKNDKINENNRLINDLKEKNKKNNESINSLKTTNDKKTKLIQTNQNTIKTNDDQITSKKTEVTNQKRIVSQKITEIQTLEKKNSDLAIDLKKNEERKTNLEIDLKNANTELAKKEKLIVENNKLLNDNKNKIQELTNSRTELEKSIAQLDAELKTLNESIEKLKKEIEENNNKIKENEALLISYAQKDKSYKDEIESLKKQLSDNEAAINSATTIKNENVNLKKQAEDKIAENKKIISDLENF